MSRPPRVLVLTASVGPGRDIPAGWLARGIRERRPDANVEDRRSGAHASGPRLYDERFLDPPRSSEARRALNLPPEG